MEDIKLSAKNEKKIIRDALYNQKEYTFRI